MIGYWLFLTLLTKCFPNEISDIKRRYDEALADIESANTKGFIKSAEYLPQVNQLMVDREEEFAPFFVEKTKEIVSRQSRLASSTINGECVLYGNRMA